MSRFTHRLIIPILVRGFIFNGLQKHCRARCATPHGVVGAAASPTATDREPLTGFGGRGRERLCPRPLLLGPASSVTIVTRLLSYTGINHHTADTRIGLMDSTVPIEAVVGM